MSVRRSIMLIFGISLLILSLLALYIFYQVRNKPAVLDLPSEPTISDMLPSVQPGISAEEEQSEVKTVSIAGSLAQAMKENDHYFLVLQVPINGNKKDITVDLGESDFILSELTIKPPPEGKTGFLEYYESKKAGQIYAEYKQEVGKIITVTLITEIKRKDPFGDECIAACAKRSQMWDTYTFNNRQLIQKESMKTIDDLTIGYISTITKEPYAL